MLGDKNIRVLRDQRMGNEEKEKEQSPKGKTIQRTNLVFGLLQCSSLVLNG